MMKTLIKTVLNIGPLLLCRWEFRRQSFIRFNERPVEYAFLFRQLARIYPRKVLDIGTGMSAVPHIVRNCGFLITAIDNMRDYWPRGTFNRHFRIINDDITRSRLQEEFDLVVCISVLEHIADAHAAMKNIFRLLAPNGYLVLTFPYTESEYIGNVYELPGSSYGQEFSHICQSYSRSDLDKWLKDNHGVIAEQEYWQFWDGSYWTVGNQIIPPVKTDVDRRHQLTCVLIQKTPAVRAGQ